MKSSNKKVIGILGDGQLAMMLAQAASKLGIESIAYGQNIKSSASYVCKTIVGEYNDLSCNKEFLDSVDIITYETENIDCNKTSNIINNCQLSPNIEILKIAQNRLIEKQTLNKLGIKTADFFYINSCDDLITHAQGFDYQCILKTCLNGYDGKGQILITDRDDAINAWSIMSEQPILLEKVVDFKQELSLIASRDKYNNIAYYPLIRNYHKKGILRQSEAPYVDPLLFRQAQKIIDLILTKFNYIGTLCVEFFHIGDELIVNEIAPRVHNSGHWTIEGAATSQFENHIRAITGLPLGETTLKGYSAMFNCISKMQDTDLKQYIDNIAIHDYHKSERKNRKLGHITINTTDYNEYNRSCQQLTDILILNNITV